jgi:hypothetical protein
VLKCFNELRTIPLDVHNRQQVATPRSIHVTLGNPPAHLVILTGIAIPHWDSQEEEDLNGAHVVVNLREPATQLLGWTASLGLANIANEDSEFTFGTDQVEVELVNTNLELHACIVVAGEPSYLHRFSYEVTAVVEIEEPLIAGTIRWQDGTLNGGPSPGNPWFELRVTTHIDDRTPFGRDDQVLASDTGAVQPMHSGTTNELPYALHGLPFNVPVTVTVSPNGLVPSPGHLLRLEQVSGPPQPITLTGQRPQVMDLDFEMDAIEAPK